MSTETKTPLIGDFLFGYVPGEDRILIKNTVEQIAAFIMENRTKGVVKVVNFLDILEVQTMGEFVDFCDNKHFLQEQLLPVLVPMQTGEAEVIEFVPYVDDNYTLENVRGIDENGKHVLVNLEFASGYTEETLTNDEVFDSEEELIAKYPQSVDSDYAGWYINSVVYDRDEFIEDYIDSECRKDDLKELLGVSDEMVAAYLQVKYEDEDEVPMKAEFKKVVTEKMNAMSNEELNAFAYKFDHYIRVKK